MRARMLRQNSPAHKFRILCEDARAMGRCSNPVRISSTRMARVFFLSISDPIINIK